MASAPALSLEGRAIYRRPCSNTRHDAGMSRVRGQQAPPWSPEPRESSASAARLEESGSCVEAAPLPLVLAPRPPPGLGQTQESWARLSLHLLLGLRRCRAEVRPRHRSSRPGAPLQVGTRGTEDARGRAQMAPRAKSTARTGIQHGRRVPAPPPLSQACAHWPSLRSAR